MQGLLPTTVENSQRFALEFLPIKAGLEVSVAKDEDISSIIRLVTEHFPELSIDSSAVWKVHHAAKSVLAIRGRRGLIGATAHLPLNDAGFARLMSGWFSVSNPDISLITRPGERCAAIYSWALCVPGIAVAAMGQVMEWMRQPSYVGRDIYACPGTPAGERFMNKIGFDKLDQALNSKCLWVYRRQMSLTGNVE